MVKVEQVKEAREDVTEPPPSGSLPPLARLGDYRIIREIGRGGMGVVYEAEQVSLGRHVALKVLPKQLLVDARTRQRFEREAKAAARLHHTNIVPVFGVGEHEGLPYYVMQFIQGLGLDEVLEELKRLQPGRERGRRRCPVSSGGGELRVAHRDVTAAEMARSLLTGRFRPAADDEATVPEVTVDGATERCRRHRGRGWPRPHQPPSPDAFPTRSRCRLHRSSVRCRGREDRPARSGPATGKAWPGSACKSPTPCSTPTPRACSIATSSRRTSCWTPPGWSG